MGFSLVEVMVGLALGSLVLGGLVSMHGQTRRLSAQSQSQADLADAGRFAMSYIESELLNAGFLGLTSEVAYIEGAATGTY